MKNNHLNILLVIRSIPNLHNSTQGQEETTFIDTYTKVCVENGVVPRIIQTVPAELSAAILVGVDGLIISGGSDIDPKFYGEENKGSVGTFPKMDESDLALLVQAKRQNIPTLGICRGMQALNTFCGGTLEQHISGKYENHPIVAKSGNPRETFRHTVTAKKDSWVEQTFGERFETNSIHHQAVDKLGEGLYVTASTEDGVVEAIEYSQDWFAVGLQWHPEKLDDYADFFAKWLSKIR